MPPKKLKGTEMTSAQGQETTRKISARVHWLQSPLTSEGTTASSTAAMTTQGVYTRANLVMKFSARAFLLPAFSTRSRILETVDSPNAFVTRTRKSPLWLTQPLMTSSPSPTSRGRLSPVSAAVSSVERPSSTTPSSGTRSPGLTTMTSPTATSSGSTFSALPSRSRLA